MAKVDNKRFYWIKIKDTFLTSDKVDFLMSQKGGSNYIVLYQLLCLKAINTNGKLARMLGDIFVPFDPEKIQRDLKWFDIDTVRVGLELLMRLDLIRRDSDGALAINDFDNLVGSETGAAERMRLSRIKSNDSSGTGQEQNGNIVPPSPHTPYPKILDIRDKRLDIRDKRLDIKEFKEDKPDKRDSPIAFVKKLFEAKYLNEDDDDELVNDLTEFYSEKLNSYSLKNVRLSTDYVITQSTHVVGLDDNRELVREINPEIKNKYSYFVTAIQNSLERFEEEEEKS